LIAIDQARAIPILLVTMARSMGSKSADFRTSSARFHKSVIGGLASLGSFAHPAPQVSQSSPSDALKSDWSRIGRDMDRMIQREHGRIQKAKKSGSR
jgi:hypothetical protein